MNPAWVFGLAGLIPFFGLAGMATIGPEQWRIVAQVLLTQYGALIVSFVGALQWGYAVQRDAQGGEAWARYGCSVVPALWSLLALQFTLLTAMQMLAVALMVCLIVDMVFYRWSPLPPWFFRLRLILTTGGASSLLIASVL
jgi:hypothetical protein